MYFRNRNLFCFSLIRYFSGDLPVIHRHPHICSRKGFNIQQRLRKLSTDSSSSRTGGGGTSVNSEEITKFNLLANEWWNPDGDFKALHSMNKLRVQLIRNGFLESGNIGPEALETDLPLRGLKILDIGCGGGILSQPLGRIGASVTGLDPGKESITIANLQLPDELKERVQFVNSSLEDFARDNPNIKFDGIVASEVVEHVSDLKLFLSVATQLLKPSGSIFVTTINRTSASWIFGIGFAEYVARLVPRGTHEWQKFVTPDELQSILLENECRTQLVHGMLYNIWSNSWSWTRSMEISYALHAIKDSS